MTEHPRLSRLLGALAATLFSIMMGCLLGFVGLFAGMYLWGHFGRPPRDPYDTAVYLSGILLGAVMAIGGTTVLLWKPWPRARPKASESSRSD